MKEKFLNIGINITFIIISVIILSVLTMLVLYMPELKNFDNNILQIIRKFLNPYPKYIPAFFSVFGMADYMLWPQITASAVLISHHKYIKAFFLVLLTQGAFYLNNLIKNYICRERPCGDIYPNFSFPSCHSTVLICFLGIIIYIILQQVKNKFWRFILVTVFSLYIFMSCISRFWLGVHYPTDVLAGIFLGLILLNLFIIIDKLFEH